MPRLATSEVCAGQRCEEQQARAVERDPHLITPRMLWNTGKVGERRMLTNIPPETEHTSSSEPLSVPSLRGQPTSMESGDLGL